MRIQLQSTKHMIAGGDARSSALGNTVPYIILLVPGVFVSLQALTAYPLLDSRLAMAFLLTGFLFPFAVLIVSILRNQEGNDGRLLRRIYVCSSVGLVLLGLFLFANGELDRSPARTVQTTVLEKNVIRGRYGARQNHLLVSSARPGRSREDLNVSSDVFDRAIVGKTLTVELHQGFFGLWWYGRISPD
jgi:hypothetical protein